MIPSQVHHLQAFRKVGTHRLHACRGGLIRALSFFRLFFVRLSSGLQLATLTSTHYFFCVFIVNRGNYFAGAVTVKIVAHISLSPRITKLFVVKFVVAAITEIAG